MKNGRKLPTVRRLREFFHYDPDSGLFFWKKLPYKTNRIRLGATAGMSVGLYMRLKLDGVFFPAHRAALAITSGVWPKSETIDHLDGNGKNNKLINLREASWAVNQHNRRVPSSSNTTGFLGVVPVPSRQSPKKFRAQISVSRRNINLGYFATPQEAHQAYLAAKRLHHPGCRI